MLLALSQFTYADDSRFKPEAKLTEGSINMECRCWLYTKASPSKW